MMHTLSQLLASGWTGCDSDWLVAWVWAIWVSSDFAACRFPWHNPSSVYVVWSMLAAFGDFHYIADVIYLCRTATYSTVIITCTHLSACLDLTGLEWYLDFDGQPVLLTLSPKLGLYWALEAGDCGGCCRCYWRSYPWWLQWSNVHHFRCNSLGTHILCTRGSRLNIPFCFDPANVQSFMLHFNTPLQGA